MQQYVIKELNSWNQPTGRSFVHWGTEESAVIQGKKTFGAAPGFAVKPINTAELRYKLKEDCYLLTALMRVIIQP
jgi:hypothetical protein